MKRIWCVPLLWCAALPAQALELGDPIEEAVAFHFTKGGLAQIGEMVGKLMPESIDVGAGAGVLECSEDDASPLTYSVADLTIRLSADAVDVNTDAGQLSLDVFATISSDPGSMSVSGDCSILQDLDETCDIQLPVTSLSANLTLSIEENDGRFDVTAQQPEITLSPMGNPLSNCTPASAIGTLLGQDESYLSNLILSFVEPELRGVAANLESGLEGMFDQMTVSTSVSVGTSPIDVEFYPSLVRLDSTGMVLGMGARMDVANPSDCVPWEDGFTGMESGWPSFSEQAQGTSLNYHAGLFVGRDFLDQMMFAFWASGTLCLEVDELNGAPLTAGLMNAVWGDELSAVLEEEAAATLVIDPRNRPTVDFSDDDPVFRLKLDDLALNMMTELDRRTLRVFEAGVDGDVGLSIDLTTEQMSVDLVFGEASLDFRDNWTDLADPGFSKVIAELAQAAIGSLLPDDLLPTVTLPYLLGLEIDAVVWLPTTDEAWHVGYVLVDTKDVEPIQLEGCSADSVGCDGSSTFDFDLEQALGCDTGSELGCSDTGAACSAVPVPLGRLIPVLFVLIGMAIRRRSGRES